MNLARMLPGKAELRRQGCKVAILAFGSMVTTALDAAEQINATVANMRFVKPLDEDMVLRLASEHELLITIEENAVMGGAGSAVNECLAAHGVQCSIVNLGLPDSFIEQGAREQLLAECGLDSNGIIHAVTRHFGEGACQTAPIRLNSY